MRIIDHKWNIVVSGIPGVTTWEDFVKWVESKNINRHSYITFAGNSYPSTVLGFKQMSFKSVVTVSNQTATVVMVTSAGQMMEDLNEPAIAFEAALSSIVEAGGNEYIVKHIVPMPAANAPATSQLVCFYY